MTRRTLPNVFPFVHPSEGWSGQLMKASLLRRLAQAQNYLYANMRRVYAGHGYEGHSNYLANMANGQTQHNLEPMPDGNQGRVVSTFYVPRNWAAGTTVKAIVRYTFTSGTGSPTARILIALYRLDGSYAGVYDHFECDANTTKNDTLRIRIPQDQDYQAKVYVTMDSVTSDTPYQNQISVLSVSARYEENVADDLHGVTPTTWSNRYEPQPTGSGYAPMASVFWDHIIQNILWLYTHRTPELCQSYLHNPWNNTTSFVEVGHYVVYIPAGVTHIKAMLNLYNTIGGAGVECRIKIDGTVAHTSTAIAAGDQVITTSDLALPDADGGEYTITIEAKNTGSGSQWGTCVWGVSVWEETIALPGSGPAANTDYLPLDEDYLVGDKGVVLDYLPGNDPDAQQSGLYGLMTNDRWLFKNRPRWLIGDWRHRVLKRIQGFSGTGVDARVDWTRGDQYDYFPGAYKNITIRGEDAYDDYDSLGDNPNGLGSETGYQETPFIYPSDMSYLRHGRRLSRHPFVVPSGLKTHNSLNSDSNFVVRARGRRVRPYLMVADSNGLGPGGEEAPYVNTGFLQTEYDAVDGGVIPIRDQPDHDLHWLLRHVGIHQQTSGTKVFILKGRLPSINSGVPPAARPEGMLFEIELSSLFIADEPLTQQHLAAL